MNKVYSIAQLRLMVMQKNKEVNTYYGALLLVNYHFRKVGEAFKKSIGDLFKKQR